MEASTLLNNTKTIANSTGTGGNYNASDPVVHLSFSEAEKRMKKLERDYQHTYKNYKETRINRFSFYLKGNSSSYRSSKAGFCIGYYQDLREQLQNDLEKLNKAEATQRRTEKPDHCKQLHGCKSLAQGKRILPRIRETQQQHLENNDLIINFSHYQSKIQKLAATEKLKDKATANGDNPTTRGSLTISIKLCVLTVYFLSNLCFPTDSEKGN
ncbi:hypothetical protein Bca52824_077284 [Brassica carinata]|uniref:Uncharacterized protein n=1 Tax=Brassica carinata TaxID=52824 RepID=A0A8X7PUM1_BRACI|nr:hypothetical protein Bca52824_077284 [Brassica carinata]